MVLRTNQKMERVSLRLLDKPLTCCGISMALILIHFTTSYSNKLNRFSQLRKAGSQSENN
jgi:hypothetical protein